MSSRGGFALRVIHCASMDEHVHLHEHEQLLLNMRPSIALFVRGVLWSVASSILVALLLMLILGGLLNASASVVFAWSFALAFLVLTLRSYLQWRHASFRVTTERILLQAPLSLLHHVHRTIKWSQYQESDLVQRGPIDLLFFVRTLKIRYGAADSKLFVSFPSLPFAEDIKHYLDKIDSAVRRSDVASLKPFIAKVRGKRD